jgi:hypothetical protein
MCGLVEGTLLFVVEILFDGLLFVGLKHTKKIIVG